ncbi:MAG TPA: LysR family transcriptional regulator [Actinomycetes bacterium]|jgi:DNA-binding transcriptional LysR family regulator|nr:LysR family transcriptional regulator [Actinomycetes bacterium]
MELRHLRYFVAVAEELHFGRAAQRLYVSAPTLSQQIQALEREVGTPLFERGSRGVRLTRAGAALLVHARASLLAAQTALREARRAGGVEDPVVRLGLLNGVPEGLPERLERLVAGVLPDRHVVLISSPSSDQVAMLQRGDLDLAVVRLPVELPDGLRMLPIAHEELGVLMSGEHPLAQADVLDPPELAGQELIWFERRLAPGFYDAILGRLRELGAAVRISDTTVAHAQLRSVLPRRPTAVSLGSMRAAQPPELVWRPLRDHPLTATIAALWRAGTGDPGAAGLEAALRRGFGSSHQTATPAEAV